LTWVSNPVIVPKKNTDVQRVCVDYTSLNKHCPKDPFPLPRIDQIIDSIAGCERLSFLDAYSGYNQIKLKKEDEEKIAFITPYGVFCYQVMPFGLKNAGATYQRIKFELFGPKVYYFGPLWDFGATFGGRGWEVATPNTKFSTTPSPQMSSKSLVSVAVWGENGDALRNPGAPPQRTPTAAGGTEGPPATIGFWCRSVCSSRATRVLGQKYTNSSALRADAIVI
jgi:hypothetical protein